MSKKTLKFDAGQLKHFCQIWHEVVLSTGTSPRPTYQLVDEPRCYKRVVTRSNQFQLNSGSFDLYQSWEFIIRDNPNYEIKKDMFLFSDNYIYVIRAVLPLENNPKYIKIITESIEDTNHALWDTINSMPFNSDKPNIIIT